MGTRTLDPTPEPSRRSPGRARALRRAADLPRPVSRQGNSRLGGRGLEGKTLLITGANTGIGQELARQSLARGAAVHVTCRSFEKATATVAALARECPSGSVRGWVADMADTAGVARLIEELRDADVRVDTLILNAGIHVPFHHRLTADGVELHRQVNFRSPAHLFRGLVSQGTLRGGAAYISSDAHHRGHLPSVFPLSFWSRYARSKLLATTFFLAARPLFPSLTISILSPGNVETDVHRYKHRWIRALRRFTAPGRTPAEAAAEILDALFESPDPEQYRNRGRPCLTAARCSHPERMLAAWREVDAGLSDSECAGVDRTAHPTDSCAPIGVLTNHAGTLERLAPSVRVPETIEDVANLVRSARRRGRTLRVVGSRHSYNDCFYSHSELISLSHFDQIGEIDRTNSTVTLGAGVSVQALCDHIDSHGYTLRWAGNSGAQTFVGAALTGTHGYCRDGGLLAELIVGVRAVSGTGDIVDITAEAELQAVRVSLGTLCTVVEATIEVRPKTGFVEYALETLDETAFLADLCAAARRHQYFRFFPNRFHPERISVLTINPTTRKPSDRAAARICYIDQSSPPRPVVALLRGLLRSPAIQAGLRALPAPRLAMSMVAPFSSLMFVNAGIVDRWHAIAGLAYEAWNDDETRNMEVAVRPEDFETFLSIYRTAERHYRAAGPRRDCYFTGRYVGSSHRTLLGANHGRDVIFVDIHATKSPGASAFLQDLERRLARAVLTRPHWGKEFAATRETLRQAYPESTWAVFDRLKREYDPDNVFSNDYTKRVFGW